MTQKGAKREHTRMTARTPLDIWKCTHCEDLLAPRMSMGLNEGMASHQCLLRFRTGRLHASLLVPNSGGQSYKGLNAGHLNAEH